MKNLFALFFILLSLGILSAQNLNFKDTNGLKILLCSHTWYRYYVNTDSTFSDRVMDSLKFYMNGSFYNKSILPEDVSNDIFRRTEIITGKWHMGNTGKVLQGDSATNCIIIEMNYTRNNALILLRSALVDGHRIKGTKRAKLCGNLDQPFIAYSYWDTGIFWNRREIWQPKRQLKKPKNINLL